MCVCWSQFSSRVAIASASSFRTEFRSTVYKGNVHNRGTARQAGSCLCHFLPPAFVIRATCRTAYGASLWIFTCPGPGSKSEEPSGSRTESRSEFCPQTAIEPTYECGYVEAGIGPGLSPNFRALKHRPLLPHRFFYGQSNLTPCSEENSMKHGSSLAKLTQ